jgi:hypothetical protein
MVIGRVRAALAGATLIGAGLTAAPALAALAGATLIGAGLTAAPALAALPPPQLHTVAGGGGCTVLIPPVPPSTAPVAAPCNGVSATSVPINHAGAVAALPDGGYLYVDQGNNLVEQVAPDGTVTNVAGNGTTSDGPDGTVATASGLNEPVAVAPLPNGGFLVTEYAGSVVRMVSPGDPTTATITTIAGVRGAPGYNGSSGPATSIKLNYPTDAELTADGRVLIADSYNNLVRILSAAAPGAMMDTVAGGGACDDAAGSCEGQTAGAVKLHHPVSVSPIQGASGGFLIAESDLQANVVRQVSALSNVGTFTTVAGAPGPAGFGGDGGPALLAQLDQPRQVVSTPDGGFLIADTNNERIRQVSPDGTITTIAGNGAATFAGDGGNATDGSLFRPMGVSPTSDGRLLIADGDNGRIRAVTNASTTTIKPGTPDGANGWYINAVTVKASATPKAKVSCVADPPQPPPVFDAMDACPSAGLAISGNGTHTIYAASKNSYGDKELPVSMSVRIDATPPTLTCKRTPSFPFGDPNAVVTATVTDHISGPATSTVSAFADTSSLGRSTATVSGASLAGLNGVVDCPYNVVPLKLRPTPRLAWSFAVAATYSTVRHLVVNRVPVHATVWVTCRAVKHGACPFGRARGVPSRCADKRCRAHTFNLTELLAGSQLPPGTRLTIAVTKGYTVGRWFELDVRAQSAPRYDGGCLRPGSSTPRKAC